MPSKLRSILVFSALITTSALSFAQWSEPVTYGVQFAADEYKGKDLKGHQIIDSYNPKCKVLLQQWRDYRNNVCGQRSSIHTRKFCFDAAENQAKKYMNFCPKMITGQGVKEDLDDWNAQAAARGQQSVAYVRR